jgi:hypothetical protein
MVRNVGGSAGSPSAVSSRNRNDTGAPAARRPRPRSPQGGAELTGTFPDVSLCTGLTGTVTNTVTDAGRYVDTRGTFHVSGTTTQDYATVWSDGSYLISHSPAHWEFNTNSSGQVVYTWAEQDQGTLYNVDGQVIGQLDVFTLNHITWKDANGNGQPDPGEIRSSVDQFRA